MGGLEPIHVIRNRLVTLHEKNADFFYLLDAMTYIRFRLGGKEHGDVSIFLHDGHKKRMRAEFQIQQVHRALTHEEGAPLISGGKRESHWATGGGGVLLFRISGNFKGENFGEFLVGFGNGERRQPRRHRASRQREGPDFIERGNIGSSVWKCLQKFRRIRVHAVRIFEISEELRLRVFGIR